MPPSDSRSYRVLSPIGQGGFGTVYRGEVVNEDGFCRQVALKFLKDELADDPEFSQQLRDEARALGLVRHNAVVGVEDLVRVDGRWAVVMEFVEGVDLHELQGRTHIPLSVALELTARVAGGLHAAYHSRDREGRPIRLTHRDIKPANIQLTAMGEVKLLDFGIGGGEFQSRESDPRGLHFGTIRYMAPERLHRVEGPAGDVYSLGVMLYEILSGRTFCQRVEEFEDHDRRVQDGLLQLESLLDVGETARGELVGFLGEMLSATPDARPSARATEHTLGKLRRSLIGPTLRDWAEEVVPPLLFERRRQNPEGLVGPLLPGTVDEGPPTPTLDREATDAGGPWFRDPAAIEATVSDSAATERLDLSPATARSSRSTAAFPEIPPDTDDVTAAPSFTGPPPSFGELPPDEAPTTPHDPAAAPPEPSLGLDGSIQTLEIRGRDVPHEPGASSNPVIWLAALVVVLGAGLALTMNLGDSPEPLTTADAVAAEAAPGGDALADAEEGSAEGAGEEGADAEGADAEGTDENTDAEGADAEGTDENTDAEDPDEGVAKGADAPPTGAAVTATPAARPTRAAPAASAAASARAAPAPLAGAGTSLLTTGVPVSVLSSHINGSADLRGCFRAHLDSGGALPGRVDFQLTIEPSGAVSAASVTTATLAGTPTSACLSGALMALSFPPFEGEAKTYRYPLNLKL
jgi:serine/threonine protein kinase